MAETRTEFNEELIQLFASSAVRTVQVQCKLKTKIKSIFVKGAQNQKPFEVAGLIGFTTPSARGSIVLCFPQAVFIKILQGLLDEQITEITSDNQDAAAELLNIISSHAKTILKKRGHEIQMAIPSVVRGTEVESRYSKVKAVHVVAFQTDVGEFYAELLLEPIEQSDRTDPSKEKSTPLTAAEKAAFFTPFLAGTVKTLEVQVGLKVKPGKPTDKVSAHHYPFDIAGVVGITSKRINGSYLIVFKQAVFLKLASKMFNEEITELQPGLEDLVAELVNMSLGTAKRTLNEQGHGIQMAIPTVIKGTHVQTNLPKDRKVIVIPFESDIGEFHVEIDIQS
jgi:chemotaxis protein CheX